MSRIGELGVNFSNLPNVLLQYQDDVTKAPGLLTIQHKTLATAQQEQCAWLVYYDERRAELKAIVKYVSLQVAKVRGEHVRKYNENYSRTLGERMINSYIDNEESFIAMNELLIEVEELYDKYSAIVDAFGKRGFALRDLTQARIADIHNIAI